MHKNSPIKNENNRIGPGRGPNCVKDGRCPGGWEKIQPRASPPQKSPLQNPRPNFLGVKLDWKVLVVFGK